LRHFLALLVLLLSPTVLFAVLLHAFVGFWRRLGPAATYAALGAIVAAGVVGVFQLREPLLAVEFGTSWPLAVLGAACLAASAWLRFLGYRHFGNAMLAGLPELAPDRHPGRLVTEGIYARIRHPRYLEVLLFVTGCALVSNHLVAYVVAALAIPAIHAVVLLEERELRARFGAAYEEYCRRVPRFLPRWRSSGRPSRA